jgi:hypothetical protein
VEIVLAAVDAVRDRARTATIDRQTLARRAGCGTSEEVAAFIAGSAGPRDEYALGSRRSA